MTAIELARNRLTKASARRASQNPRVIALSPRHEDSECSSQLQIGPESAPIFGMETAVPSLPNDIAALQALVVAESRAGGLADEAAA